MEHMEITLEDLKLIPVERRKEFAQHVIEDREIIPEKSIVPSTFWVVDVVIDGCALDEEIEFFAEHLLEVAINKLGTEIKPQLEESLEKSDNMKKAIQSIFVEDTRRRTNFLLPILDKHGLKYRSFVVSR